MSQVMPNSQSSSTSFQPRVVEGMVTVSEEALKQFQQTLQNSPDAIGIRLGVSGGGCAGLQYKMEPAEAVLEGDLLQEVNGMKFFIHPMAAPYLKGIHLDYTHSMMESGFKFINPNAASTCGCGTSFGV